MAKGKVRKEVEKYEKKVDKDHDKPKPKRSGNQWTQFVSKRYHELRKSDPNLKFKQVLSDPQTKQAYMASKNKLKFSS